LVPHSSLGIEVPFLKVLLRIDDSGQVPYEIGTVKGNRHPVPTRKP
jgi:hypothetical protein